MQSLKTGWKVPKAKEVPIPGIGVFQFPLGRDELMILLVAFNMIAIGFETYLAHLISGGIKPSEAIPVFFGPIAGIIVIIALFVRVMFDKQTITTLVILGMSALSVVVGILGASFHWERGIAPAFVEGSRLRWDWLIHAPPALAPLAFAGIGLMGILSVLKETEPGSGCFEFTGILRFNTPLSKTRQLLWLVGLGIGAATISAFIDHSRTDFSNFFIWTPTVLGIFGTVVTLLMAIYERHTTSDYFIFFWVMILMIIVGVLGLGFHINADLPEGPQGGINTERFIRNAPVMAPLLFANMGILGLITMVGAEVDQDDEQTEDNDSNTSS
ncbi:MAG: hypothetical protein CUN55_13780 [Phototrophicales bacterium]|nr:MAG: hypothetical protein CUN55_13780 [Phototrophicales bacterium]